MDRHHRDHPVQRAGSGIVPGLLVAGAGALLALAALTAPVPARALTLQEALAHAYASNPTLGAERAQARAVDEQVPLAMSGYRPTVNLTASVSRELSNSRYQPTGGERTESNVKTVTLSASQPLFDATVPPAVRRAERLIEAERATVIATGQTVLTQAATAYMDVVRDQEIVTLNTRNVELLKRQLKAAEDRARIGELTRTDVAQAQSRLAQAVASRSSAEGTLESDRATFTRVVGLTPGRLSSAKPVARLAATLPEAIALARSNNPSVLGAAYRAEAQHHAVDQIAGKRLPSATLAGSASRSWDPGRSDGVDYTREDDLTVSVKIVAPLYQAGLPEAQIREAKHTEQQNRLQIQEAADQGAESVVTAWASLETARATIQSYRAQIVAAQTALAGVRDEALVGTRTMLDVLDQEQELLNSRVNLVRAEHDEMVAVFQLLAACGQLTAQQLGLPTGAS